MNKLKILFSTVIRVFFTLLKVRNVLFNKKETEYIVWAPNFFSLSFFTGDNFLKVFFTYYYLRRYGREATIYTRQDIGQFNKKKIIYFGGEFYNVFGFNNYLNALILISETLEEQNNLVFPSSQEVRLWENKAYMHSVFERLGIRTPISNVYNIDDFDLSCVEQFPLLVKEEHSCSAKGVYKIVSREQLESLIFDEQFQRMNRKVILQELLNIRRDLRVILVDDEIVLHYWRVNLSKEWKPTSTGHGSKVDFVFFPEQWRQWIIDSFKKLEIKTGAFDIAWQDDDLNTEPYILEVSPFYQPNPRPLRDYNLMNYGKWKKSIQVRDSYQLGMVNVIAEIQSKFVKKFIKID
jgi:hypothetical protein